jgi:hypothetical protein
MLPFVRAEVNKKMKQAAQTVPIPQVDQKSTALARAQQMATTNMENSLSEMASRIHLVLTDTVAKHPAALAILRQSHVTLREEVAPPAIGNLACIDLIALLLGRDDRSQHEPSPRLHQESNDP